MPYIELRNYASTDTPLSETQRDSVVQIVRDNLARGQDIDGTFEFRYLARTSELDHAEYAYILVIDMGWTEAREAAKHDLATKIGFELAPVLDTDSLAVRLRLQNAAFVPYEG